jgi:hypothetical protein
MKRWLIIAPTLILLPLLGVIAAGRELTPYLAFPPFTRYVPHADFSWLWFAWFVIVDLSLIGFLFGAVYCGHNNAPPASGLSTEKGRFPWWGWAAIIVCLAFWLLAWTRFTWFSIYQQHTFFPIWLGFIFSINAVTAWRCGSCLLLRQPVGFLLLFPVSAAFWWVFEFLNRFVQNWYYTGIENLGPVAYFCFASVSFATVLPAVLSMTDLLVTFPALGKGLACGRPLILPTAQWIPWTVLALSGAGLLLIGLFPDQLFALLWVSPLLVMLSIQRLAGKPTILASLRNGDWRPVVIPALAAIICGFFWEMWNYFSFARWLYAIPFVQRYQLFEMPILGYGGYLPFGLACLVVGTPVVGDLFKDQAPA